MMIEGTSQKGMGIFGRIAPAAKLGEGKPSRERRLLPAFSRSGARIPVIASHIPVLLQEVLAALAPKHGARIIDGTFGAGGYSAAILDAVDCEVLAIDRDPTAIAAGASAVAARKGRLTLAEGQFGALQSIAEAHGWEKVDGIVLDIGVSSMQIDRPERGFSFQKDGPLDMRMAMGGQSAADILADASEAELADIFYYYGEERFARPIARAIVADRVARPFVTTKALADLIGRIVHAKPGQIHPATRVFQALRIAVNDELGELVDALHAAERVLKPGGVLAVVTFHSLEDRIVKQFLAARSGKGGTSRFQPEAAADAPTFRLQGKAQVSAGEAEAARNPRARSARLRAALRTAAPARSRDEAVDSLARLPEPQRRKR
jgi:16S rRNA (cytosine1402-N4)-methyltransferase